MELNASGLFDSGWTYTKKLIAANDSIIIPFQEFTKGDGTRFNTDTTKPQSLSMSCLDTGDGRGSMSRVV